ncbi:MAG TPA: endonuclease III [Gaiellales bacterium]|nr:endonuclease III [Gaiellales bacterium]
MPMAEILDRLEAAYGSAVPRTRRPALDELVLTILSQNTSDRNSEHAYARMRERFPAWEDVRDAPEAELVEALRPGGLAVQKAPRIQAVLRDLERLDLEWLAGLPPDEAMRWLVALPGVGPKTASCVLLFSLDVPVMPVDTHIHRIALRVGLVPAGTSADAAHALLTAMTPPERMLEAHLLLIRHGRITCTARRPRCEECVLVDLCDYGRSLRT